MRSFLFALLCLLSLSVSAQWTGDTISTVSAKRAQPSFNPTNKSFSIRYNNGSSTTQYTFWQGLKKLNGSTPDANGNLTIPVGATTFSGLGGSLAASQFGTLSGDVNTAGGTYVTTISNNAVGNVKLAQMPTLTFKGNNTGSTANALDLTVSQTKTALSLDLVDNTPDNNKPVSTIQATAIAVKASAKKVSLSAAANGTSITHSLNNSNVVVFFRPTGAAQYDPNFSWSVTDANSITIITPFDASGTRETFTGDVFVYTAN